MHAMRGSAMYAKGLWLEQIICSHAFRKEILDAHGLLIQQPLAIPLKSKLVLFLIQFQLVRLQGATLKQMLTPC